MAHVITAVYLIDHDSGQGRISVKGFLGRQIFEWDDALDVSDNLRKAAQLYLDRGNRNYVIGPEKTGSYGCSLRFLVGQRIGGDYACN